MQDLQNKIVCGDCIEILGKVKEPFVDLVFADPPFNIGYTYDKYHDKVEKNNYLAWTRDWMAACKNVLKAHGSFYIAIGDEYAANIRIIGDELGLTLRNWIIWHYTFGQQTKDKFARSHAHIFYFVKDAKNYTFNEYAIRVPSDRQLLYADARANAEGKMPNDVWSEFSRVCGTFKERVGWHPCQMPEKLLGRIICTSSKPGDCVLDPFNGSGTTAAAAIRFGRNYTGFDISEDYVARTQERLKELRRLSKASSSDGLDWLERNELERLFIESPVPMADVLANKHALEIYANQFSLRMNNGKMYNPIKVAIFFKRLMNETVVPKAKGQKLRTRQKEPSHE
jgi:site-specific DNA-methyltransferase (adenine-specific)